MMPTLDLTLEECQALINARAMQDPLVRKVMDQLQEQQNAADNTQRGAAVQPPTDGLGSDPERLAAHAGARHTAC